MSASSPQTVSEITVDLSKLIIRKYTDLFTNKTVYGCIDKVSEKFFTGIGCIIYDPTTGYVILGNEANKLSRIQQLNPGVGIDTYYEDFGGKVEYKHECMHIFDVAISELYEESAMVYNLNFKDFEDKCKLFHVDVPTAKVKIDTTEYQPAYLTVFIPSTINGNMFEQVSKAFQDNLTVLKSGRFICQKQFYEISSLNMFHYENILDHNSSGKINGYYGGLEDIYLVPDKCGASFVSLRAYNVIQKAKDIFNNTSETIKAQIFTTYGINQVISDNNINESMNGNIYKSVNPETEQGTPQDTSQNTPQDTPDTTKQPKDGPCAVGNSSTSCGTHAPGAQSAQNVQTTTPTDCKNNAIDDANKDDLLTYLHKFFVSHAKLDGLILGGDVPLMYYNEIARSFPAPSKHRLPIIPSDRLPIIPYTKPKIVLYCPSLCVQMFDNVYIRAYGEVDTTNTVMKKFSIDDNVYKEGVFFNINNRIYFSCTDDKKTYYRFYLGMARLRDESIHVFDDLIFRQSLGVDVHNAVALKCLQDLRKLKSTFAKDTCKFKFFDCPEINRARHGHRPSLENFIDVAGTYYKKQNQADQTNQAKETNQAYKQNYVNLLKIKGNYQLFAAIYKQACGDKTYETQISAYNKAFQDCVNKGVQSNKVATDEQYLARCSGPFEMDCQSNVGDMKMLSDVKGKTFEYNGIVFASEYRELLPTFYLNQGLYDCFLIKANEGEYVPLHRLKNGENDDTFAFYKVASECIYPSGKKFQVDCVQYELINVVTSSTTQKLIEKKHDKDETYWRRVIYLSVVKQPQSEPSTVAAPSTVMGGTKTNKRGKPRVVSTYKSRVVE